jgi:hypothetical protein
MKLNFKLELNTIILFTLILVFSSIIYYNFKRNLIEGIQTQTAFEKKKIQLDAKNVKLSFELKQQQLYANAWRKYEKMRNEINKLRNDYNQLGKDKNTTISSDITNLQPPKNIMIEKIEILSRKLKRKVIMINNKFDKVYNKYITGFVKFYDDFTSENYKINNNKITEKINEIKREIAIIKKEIETMLVFTIQSIVPGDKNVTIKILPSSSANANSYKIFTDNNISLQVKDIKNPIIFSGLKNDIPYKFKTIAYYNWGYTSEAVYAKLIMLRAPPSLNVTSGDSKASVIIQAPIGAQPLDYNILVTPRIGTVLGSYKNISSAINITGLTNNTEYTFKVIANYSDGTKSESGVVKVKPRGQPIIGGMENSNEATINIVAPIGDKPNTYTITANSSDVPVTTIPYTSKSHTFKDLKNEKPYSFNVFANYTDGKSSPKTVKIVPRERPKAGITTIPGNAKAIIRITPPTNNLPTSISNYVITSIPPTPNPITYIKPSDSKNITITGLRNETPYKFSVIVNYIDGTYSSSNDSFVTPSAAEEEKAAREKAAREKAAMEKAKVLAQQAASAKAAAQQALAAKVASDKAAAQQALADKAAAATRAAAATAATVAAAVTAAKIAATATAVAKAAAEKAKAAAEKAKIDKAKVAAAIERAAREKAQREKVAAAKKAAAQNAARKASADKAAQVKAAQVKAAAAAKSRNATAAAKAAAAKAAAAKAAAAKAAAAKAAAAKAAAAKKPAAK